MVPEQKAVLEEAILLTCVVHGALAGDRWTPAPCNKAAGRLREGRTVLEPCAGHTPGEGRRSSLFDKGRTKGSETLHRGARGSGVAEHQERAAGAVYSAGDPEVTVLNLKIMAVLPNFFLTLQNKTQCLFTKANFQRTQHLS